MEDDVAVIRCGAGGPHRTRPAHGPVAAPLPSLPGQVGSPLPHDHLLQFLRGLRPDGKWGAPHFAALLESAVAASALSNEVVMAEACEAPALTSEPRAVTAGCRPVMEVAGVPQKLRVRRASPGRGGGS
ncbi:MULTISPECIES: hypothetical protein [unclassified Streptomyces]|uniref:hypothetical protein n=1 Tax=unclassified Streptomyces TaxID=2593676 RepID=UPI0038305193